MQTQGVKLDKLREIISKHFFKNKVFKKHTANISKDKG